MACAKVLGSRRVRSACMLTDGVLKVEPTAFIDTLDEGWRGREPRDPGGQGSPYREWGLAWSWQMLRGLGLTL